MCHIKHAATKKNNEDGLCMLTQKTADYTVKWEKK